jgi:threonine dehydratase
VIGVEPEISSCLAPALDRGEPIDTSVGGIAADSLGSRRVGEIAFAIARDHVDRCVTVSDDAIRDAQRAFWQELHQLAEPGGAAALAAVMTGAYRPAPGERTVVVVCGANGDPVPVVGEVREVARP